MPYLQGGLYMCKESSQEILSRFLNTSVSDGSEIFHTFSQLPNAIYAEGTRSHQRYVFVPGKRRDAVVLVAHADTVWDKIYGGIAQSEVAFHDGIFHSAVPICGIGADDRAGCAMLWALRNCGHSLLIVDGEEHGKSGANFLRNNRKLFRKVNRHRFMIELDWCGTNSCLYHQVDNSEAFKHYMENSLGLRDDKKGGGCDLQVLCRKICGVNVGVGYHNHHGPAEYLVLSEWENTLKS